MSVQEIKEAVQQLTLEERAEVAACLHSWNDDAWDEQMKRDLASGKLAKLLAQVDAEIAKNELCDMQMLIVKCDPADPIAVQLD